MTDETTPEVDSDNVSPSTEGVAQTGTPTTGFASANPDVSTDDISVSNAEGSDSESDPETFPREYVEKLRQENGKYRQRAGEADALATRLHTELVRATGRLADPTDLPFDADHLADADKMVAAIEDLLTRKPHLATRRPLGEIGQGATPSGGTVDLAAILRGKAG